MATDYEREQMAEIEQDSKAPSEAGLLPVPGKRVKRKSGGHAKGETEHARLDRSRRQIGGPAANPLAARAVAAQRIRNAAAVAAANRARAPGAAAPVRPAVMPQRAFKKGGETDHDKHAKGGWIKGAIKHPGALHRELGVPEGEKIPEKKLEKAEHSDNPTLRRRAVLAKTLKGLH